jgi:C4-dicarboxylate-specific signal transduction histidine kinase
LWAGKGIIGRIASLVRASEHISQGDFSQVVRDENRDEIGRLARAYEEMRTAIDKRTRELIEANEVLQKTQAELVQSEKLGMLGQLAAGVAHEINTPTGAIINVATDAPMHLARFADLGLGCDSIDPGRRTWVRNILQKTFTTEGENGDPNSSNGTGGSWSQRRAVEKKLKQADFSDTQRMAAVVVACGLEESLEDPEVVNNLSNPDVLGMLSAAASLMTFARISHTSAKKIARIVRALKYYARSGPEEKMEVDVNESLDCTLAILHNRLKHCADVKTDFGTGIPMITSGPDLSQIWTNILNNACDAIEEHMPGKLGVVEVASKFENENVIVRIYNEGPPIPDSIRDKMFDPFTTTKAIGKGTGLGLSICSGILQRMGGEIKAENEENGVAFKVILPVKGNKDAEEQ